MKSMKSVRCCGASVVGEPIRVTLLFAASPLAMLLDVREPLVSMICLWTLSWEAVKLLAMTPSNDSLH